MITFNLDFSIVSIVGLAVALLAGLIALSEGLKPQRRTGRLTPFKTPELIDEPCPTDEVGENEVIVTSEESVLNTNTEDTEIIAETAISPTLEEKRKERAKMAKGMPMASVIAYTPEDSEILEDFIEMVRKQDYPLFELILVLNAGAETRAMLAEKYSGVPGLYLTFIPPGSQNLSRRKLAITLGMKAAKGDVAVITTSFCHIASEKWLSGMMAPFVESRYIEVVLGCTRPESVGARGLKGLYRRWYSANTTLQWTGYALDGKPYRGDAMNLAFRRDLFFNHKGFAQTINLHVGDDDLFVNEITNAANTRIVLDSDTILTVMWRGSASKMYVDRRESHDFTSRWLPRGPFRRSSLLSWCQWLLAGGCIAGAVGTLPNLLPAVCALVILTSFFISETFTWSRGYAVIAPKKRWWSTPWFLLWKPLGNLFFRWRHRADKIKNYTWQCQRRTS